MTPLVGKFHSHLTISSDDINVLKRAASIAKGKLTVIDLANSDIHGRECMITNHFVTGYRGFENADQIIAHIKQVAVNINKLIDVNVIRIKVEHELFHPKSISSQIDQSLHQYDYTECHIKTLIQPGDNINLSDIAIKAGWRLSSNPYSVSTSGIVQFVNTRFYTNEYIGTDILGLIKDSVDQMKNKLYTAGYHILECKIETAVYDSNIDLDAWWVN